jgi:hypothetical protein
MILACFHQTTVMENKDKNANSDPQKHTSFIKEKFKELSDHLREDVLKVNDPKAKALFEVSAEVLDGLQKAFSDYEQKSEPAWENK